MLAIDVTVGKLKVKEVVRKSCTLDVHFNDLHPKTLTVSGNVDDGENFSERIIQAIRAYEKEQNKDAAAGDSFLDRNILVRIKDEERVQEQMKQFFNKIDSKLKQLQGRSAGPLSFINLVNEIKNMEMSFH